MIEALKQWAFTLVITAVTGSVAVSMTVSENGKSIKKYIKFACSLVALMVMISPIRGLFQEFPSFFNFNTDNNISISESNSNSLTNYDNYDNDDNNEDGNMKILNDLIIEKTAELLKERISGAIYQKTGIKPENIYIYIKQKENINSINSTNTGSDPRQTQTEVYIEKVEIDMPENTEENIIKETEAYLKELLNCDIFVNY